MLSFRQILIQGHLGSQSLVFEIVQLWCLG